MPSTHHNTGPRGTRNAAPGRPNRRNVLGFGVIAAGALASVRHLKESGSERARHQERVAAVRARLKAIGIPMIDNPSHIVPVMVKDPVKCKWISDWLMANHGIYVQPINHPTVPKGTERLRITPSPAHSDADIDRLVRALCEIWSQCALARQVA